MRGNRGQMTRVRGFGCLRLDDGSEVFFNHSAMAPGSFHTLQEGQELKFQIETDPRGRGQRAANVQVAPS